MAIQSTDVIGMRCDDRDAEVAKLKARVAALEAALHKCHALAVFQSSHYARDICAVIEDVVEVKT